MLKKILFLLLADLLVLTILIIWMDADPSVSIIEVVIIPVLFVVNFAFALILYSRVKKETSKALFFNSILAPTIFHLLFKLWFLYYHKTNFENYQFSQFGKKYEITLWKKDNYFALSDITNQKNGSTTGLIFGDYNIKEDSIFLIDSTHKIIIFENKVIGYPKPSDTILIDNSKD